MSLPSECHEHDARDQHPILTDEGESALLDSEGLPVQRYVPGWPSGALPRPSFPHYNEYFFLTSHGLGAHSNSLFFCFYFSESGLCKVQGHALGTGSTQGSKRHQPLLSTDVDRGRRRKPL